MNLQWYMLVIAYLSPTVLVSHTTIYWIARRLMREFRLSAKGHLVCIATALALAPIFSALYLTDVLDEYALGGAFAASLSASFFVLAGAQIGMRRHLASKRHDTRRIPVGNVLAWVFLSIFIGAWVVGIYFAAVR